jgi:hypothetical protein
MENFRKLSEVQYHASLHGSPGELHGSLGRAGHGCDMLPQDFLTTILSQRAKDRKIEREGERKKNTHALPYYPVGHTASVNTMKEINSFQQCERVCGGLFRSALPAIPGIPLKAALSCL